MYSDYLATQQAFGRCCLGQQWSPDSSVSSDLINVPVLTLCWSTAPKITAEHNVKGTPGQGVPFQHVGSWGARGDFLLCLCTLVLITKLFWCELPNIGDIQVLMRQCNGNTWQLSSVLSAISRSVGCFICPRFEIFVESWNQRTRLSGRVSLEKARILCEALYQHGLAILQRDVWLTYVYEWDGWTSKVMFYRV